MIPPDCICYSYSDCDRFTTAAPTTEEPTTISTVAPVTDEADQKLEELQETSNRFRGQFDRNSFTIMSQHSDENGSTNKICNGIRVDFEHILTRKECCEENVRLFKGERAYSIPFLFIKKDPCSNVDPVVMQQCQDSPGDCPDLALLSCNEVTSQSDNCFIQHHLDWEEKASEMCPGATPTDCWTFATTKEDLTPCIVPMVEVDGCPDDELCTAIAPDFLPIFNEQQYTISIGAAAICQVKDQSFMRGIAPGTVVGSLPDVVPNPSSVQRLFSANMIIWEKTDADTTAEVDGMTSANNLVPAAVPPNELYARHVTGFEHLGEGDPYSRMGEYGASNDNFDCTLAQANDEDAFEGFPYVVRLLMQTEDQIETAEGNQCSGTIISEHWVATSESCCDGAEQAILDFSDDRTGSGGNGGTSSSTVSMPCIPPACFAGRKRRDAHILRRKRRDGDNDYDDESCHTNGFCKKNGICLIHSHINILKNAEIHSIAAKKICLPKMAPIHGKRCWIGGWNNSGGSTRQNIEVNMFNCDAEGATCDFPNEYCMDHAKYKRECPPDSSDSDRKRRNDDEIPVRYRRDTDGGSGDGSGDGGSGDGNECTTFACLWPQYTYCSSAVDGGATSEMDGDPMTIPDNLVCAGYPTMGLAGHDPPHEYTPGGNNGYSLDHGGPIICKEPFDPDDEDSAEFLSFVGIAYSNMLSHKEGEPGLFTRVFNERDWIIEKLEQWSAWTECDHTCVRTRDRACGYKDDETIEDCPNCECVRGLVTETETCTPETSSGEESQDSEEAFCYKQVQNILPSSRIDAGDIEICGVELPRFRRDENQAITKHARRKRTVKKQTRIVNGADIEPYSWPWLVRLNFLTLKQHQENVEHGIMCSGTIFHENWVMTAAHCCLHKYKVIMHFNDFHTGVVDTNELNITRYGGSFNIHEDYHPREGNDICLIELPGDFHGSRAPCMLPLNNDKTAEEQIQEHHGAQCWVGGWGHTFYAGQSSNVARSVGLNLFSREYCKKHSFYPDTSDFKLNDDVFCAGIPHNKDTETNSAGNHVTQKGADSCKGDSGGPLICDINDRITFMGIVSKGYRCDHEGYPGIYTNVQKFRSWLDESKYCV